MRTIFNTTYAKIFIAIFFTSSIALVGTGFIIKTQLDERFETFLDHQEEMRMGFETGDAQRMMPRPEREPQFIKITEDYKNGANNAIVVSSLIGILTAGILAFVVSKEITNPIKNLQNTIRQVRDSKFKNKAEVYGSEEIKELISEFNTLITELDKVETLREELITDVAHELKTPITKIRGQLEGIVDGIYTDSEIQISKALNNLGQLEYLIQQLQNLIEIKSKKDDFEKKNINLNEFVSNILESFNKEGITKIIDIPSDVTIEANRYKFKEILDNLLDNAFKHTNSGQISVTFKNNLLEIKDTGAGIPEKEIPFIFERFYRADKSRNKTTGGLGLGLAIVKELVELHGWTITADSQIEKGTTFTICFKK